MTNWQAWMACGVLMSLPAAAQADIFRWDNGQLIPGTQGIAPGPASELGARVLQFAELSNTNLTGSSFYDYRLHGSDLTGARFTNANLSYAVLTASNLSGADFAGATVVGTYLYVTGFTKEQLYSTASYQAKDLHEIQIGSLDLSGWELSGQDLTGAALSRSTLTDANLAGAYLRNAYLDGATLTNADLSGTNLTNAVLAEASLTNADLAGAVVAGANFESGVRYWGGPGGGIALPQLYSTASYQQKNLRGIGLEGNDLTGGDFSGQDLTGAFFSSSTLTNSNLSGTNLRNAELAGANLANADLSGASLTFATLTNANLAGAMVTGANFLHTTLTNANFSFADLRGARMEESGPIQLARNTIRELGAINGLDLAAGETLVVRDSDIGITVNESMNAVSGGTLELVLADADWGSTMAVAAGVTPDLGGTLRVRFVDQANFASMLGTTFDFFDWFEVLESNNRFDTIELPPGTLWDFSQLYVTGTATLTAIPEPPAVLLFACGIAACALIRRVENLRPRR